MSWSRRLSTAILVLGSMGFGWLSSSQLAWATPPDLILLLGERERRVDSRRQEGSTYYQLKDVADIFRLRQQETDSQLRLHGPRGTLLLSPGRPLIRTGDQYLLLSRPVWRRKRGDWYVPEEFFTRALPLILRHKLELVSEGRFRVESLLENRVEVRLANHPDHVRVVFEPDQQARLRVQEFEEYIQIEFDDYLVRPQLPRTKPDRQVVSSLQFSSETSYGTFRIQKGAAYQSYREYDLDQPNRKVIEVRGVRSGRQAAAAEDTAIARPREVAPAADRPLLPLSSRTPNAIVLDPGHGGEDYGLHPSPEIFEKDFTFALSSRIRRELERRGYHGLLTRNRDVKLNATQRSSIGNHYQPRLFVSLHMGAAPSGKVSGPIVYIHHYTDGSTSGSKPGSDLSLVRWEEGQRPYLRRSRQLAETIQRNLNGLTGSSNSVSEVPLAVLTSIRAPAVLVETGFATNLQDRLKMQSTPYQERLAEKLVAAIFEFLGDSQEVMGP